MQFIVYGMIASVMLAEYLQATFHLPRQIGWLPELTSLAAALIVIVRLPINQFRDVNPRYLFIFTLLGLHIVVGVIANTVDPGVIFSGIRIYFKYIPFFFLPLVVHMQEKDLKRQLLLIGAICLVQLPLAWHQRSMTTFGGGTTGDQTYGTLIISSYMSMFLCGTAAVAMGLYYKRMIKMSTLILFFVLTLPATMLNETKATLILLPLCLLIPALFAGEGASSAKVKRAVVALVIVSAFTATFIPIYDHFIAPRWGYGIVEFFTKKGRVAGYLDKGATIGTREPGRVDSMILPFTAAEGDPGRIAVGLGISNNSQSFMGRGFTGEYFPIYGHLVGPTVSLFLWEIGVVGTLLALFVFYLIYTDAMTARRAAGFEGGVALGWVGVTVLMFIGVFYKNIVASNALSYMFWFYSGVVAATATRVRRASAAAPRARFVAEPPVRRPVTSAAKSAR